MKQILDKLNATIGKFTFNQKVVLGGILIAITVSLVIFSSWMQSEETSVLFTNLEPQDAATALDELAKQNVNAELTNGGTTILVPQDQVHKLRVDLSAKGIPSSGIVGWGLFDGNQYGMTEFVQNVNYKRAMEGELVKTIEALSSVNNARVHLVLPKNSIFKKMQSPATASVVLAIGHNNQLSQHQVNGIQSLVSGSVEGLEINNVSVIDQNGIELTTNLGNETIMQSDSQLAMKIEVDNYLTSKAETMLAQVLGAERTLVQVDATLNFEQMQQERIYHDPENSHIISETRTESDSGEAGGFSEDSTVNYELDKTVETLVSEIGGIKNLSVAVFVDGKYEENSNGEMIYVPLPTEELQQIGRIVESSVGLNADRGDRIEVVNMQFQMQEEQVVTNSGMVPEGWMQTVPELIGRILLFAIAAFMVLKLKKNLGQMAAETKQSPKTETVKEKSDTPSIQELANGHVSTERMVEEVKNYAGDNPEQVADLVSAWVKDNQTTTV